MGILEQTPNSYYNDSSSFGNYQFTSLEDIINQFITVYVGEDKIINKARRIDVAFHAQRALAELSFDTFKSVKSQEIVLPPSLTMTVPHDYINYTKISWSDGAGIKHPLYPIRQTSNPFKIKQYEDGGYDFDNQTETVFIDNADFSSSLTSTNWEYSIAKTTKDENGDAVGTDKVETNSLNQLIFTNNYDTRTLGGVSEYFSHQYAVWQLIEINGEATEAVLNADGLSTAAATGKNIGVVRVGLSNAITGQNTQGAGSSYSTTLGYDPYRTHPLLPTKPSFNMQTSVFDLDTVNGLGSYIEFSTGNNTLTSGEQIIVNVSNLPLNANGNKEVYLLIVSDNGIESNSVGTNTYTQKVDNITMTVDGVSNDLLRDGDSTTWTNYKGNNPATNQTDIPDYDDELYTLNVGRRYGLDSSMSQNNGSFYIDTLKGLIHFSSTVSGKTVILDYISDSLGTDGEMKVHKFAEEAMYKWITHAVLATKANTPEYLVNRYKREKIAATRAAKLRLSNLKLEEITQILRGRSKHIKH